MSTFSLNSPQRSRESTPSKKHQATPYRKPTKSTPKRRESSYWYQTVDEMDLQQLDAMQVKRQEVCAAAAPRDVTAILQLAPVTIYSTKSLYFVLCDHFILRQFDKIL